ncbi:GGDEF domain-containing protein [Vibrio sinensis]|uniref:diguanylate cyclase n=1 Tax=Vibrio sinensis TaxID=2302434 RepID=A0A3A6QXC0_9VIBR|nr:bacteriohemerythrin [Vibrio sinensis]RJX67400.1 GGDEF domain-containing protein [Vibrio sinensis]
MPNNEIVVFPWNKNFETGIQTIDDQHKNLFLLVNKLANSLVHENHIEVAEVFDELADYAQYHFSEEERIWGEYFQQDGWMQTHAQVHDSFIPDISKIKERASTSNWQETIENILQFLIRWLALHILDDDKKMCLALHELKNGATLDEAKRNTKKQMKGSVGVLIDTVLTMYEELSAHAIDLIREKHRRIIAEKKLMALNKKLHHIAITDELSGLFNRRHFMTVIPEQIQQAKSEQYPLSFIAVDLDHFKALNDSLGHLKGDEGIEQVSRVLSSMFNRPGDFVFRMGGEEFLVVVCHSNPQEVCNLSEVIRTHISNIILSNPVEDIHHQLTCSIGVFNHIPVQQEDFLFFLDKADKALYEAKANGRNIVVCINNKTRC